MKLVDCKSHHIWTDALHGRQLARQTKNRWNRSTYVRWTVISAWTVFEAACEEALETKGLGNRFRDNLDSKIGELLLEPLDWSNDPWKSILDIYERRKKYVHPVATYKRYFEDISTAEKAVSVLREGVKAIFAKVKKPFPSWISDDTDIGWTKGDKPLCRGHLEHASVSKDDPNRIEVRYVYQGKEHLSQMLPPGTDPGPYVEALKRGTIADITEIRVYKGDERIKEIPVQIRGF